MKENQHTYPSEQKGDSREVPLPEEQFRKLGIASRPTFFRWEKQGLRILRINNRRFIYQSDLIRFLERLDASGRETEASSDSEPMEDREEVSK
jgi:thioredoxin-related protein